MSEGSRKDAVSPLVAHIIHRLDVGGMENGLVNLINHMPPQRYRHAIICMTDYTDFAERIQRDDVSLHALNKREGKDLAVHGRLWRLLRELRPDIVHTRNMATLESQVTAALAGVRHRVHGEHGWDMGDLDGSRIKTQRMRRLVRPLVGQFIALSRHQLGYLQDAIGVPASRLNHVCNGVNTGRFRPAALPDDSGCREADGGFDIRGREPLPRGGRDEALPEGFAPEGTTVIGAVMRMQAVKAPEVLLEAFIQLCQRPGHEGARLVMIGDGPKLAGLRERVEQSGLTDRAWLPGARDDVPDLMRAMDLFVVPSLAEGICNTILEAMATGLPVTATHVGGNPDLVEEGHTGRLIPAGDVGALTDALAGYLASPETAAAHGANARARAEASFSMDAMVQGYMDVYDGLVGSAR
ncbi:glycosyltransferase [Ectothiorhodospira variabilis]|uniref:glycosyltransferase n=1 Tax=Ectothiorhodospira variabilis TaxID=505694 RepID=UPI001EFBB8CB|nr:glycosyltransferase [Ectothiorhodospira variabilis]MCG5494773.1 glycosyltransferase [Ectothiorhodospira variabilis]MCG5504338.1 glycosyltransferase [Ectothiorhodospira variabilis]MCG5507493.1 glycosyltransferase [Ectothiorhodospira variabilis]